MSAASPDIASDAALGTLAETYRRVRRTTERLVEPLAVEDCVIQTMEDVSPTKWHLAHTSWFFETFALQPWAPSYALYHEGYPYLFNSYYVQAGERHCRDRRGYISRPTVAEVMDYRRYVDEHLVRFMEQGEPDAARQAAKAIELGIQHEQQHQELILTDIKHVLSVNPLRPVYEPFDPEPGAATPLSWVPFEAGVYEVGHAGGGFAYDNEGPRHRCFLEDFLLADRPVTNAEYMAFMEDGGYQRPEWWLSMGWAVVQERAWTEPFYWERRDGVWQTYTLGGMKPVAPHEPVVHISYFEADAYARWAGARLPTEQEWEVAATACAPTACVPAGSSVGDGHFLEDAPMHPRPACPPSAAGTNGRARLPALRQRYGNVWEWTRSQYDPYPGYAPAEGALGEYNGKFMCNQFVLRGGSCATPRTHIRPTYRNFFPPDATWQFTGFRLARDS